MESLCRDMFRLENSHFGRYDIPIEHLMRNKMAVLQNRLQREFENFFSYDDHQRNLSRKMKMSFLVHLMRKNDYTVTIPYCDGTLKFFYL